MKMSDTPETDALEYGVTDDYGCVVNVVSSCLARKLERERNELRAKYAEHHAEAERLTKEIKQIRSEIRVLRAHLASVTNGSKK